MTGTYSLAEQSQISSEQAFPFIKWPGGKQWIAESLAEAMQPFSGRYFEPFLGGGSVFFALQPKTAFLSDRNEELITTFRVVQNDVERLIKRLRSYEYTEDCYYEARASRPWSPTGIAARFFYLNRTAWNGLYRVNGDGNFNVPMGRFENTPNLVPSERLRHASNALTNVKLKCSDFRKTCRNAKNADLVYFDPPYTVIHNNNGFLRYNDKIFSWQDQEDLADLVHQLDRKGVWVVVSNAAHQPVINLYQGFNIKRIKRHSVLAADRKKRRVVSECLISNFDLII